MEEDESFSIPETYKVCYRYEMEKEEHKFIKDFWIKGWGSEWTHGKLIIAPGDDVYGPSRIKIWLQTFTCSDLPCQDLSRPG
jgi:hypothetical protein